MKKEVVILSLGGSLIVPEKVDIKFLKEFKKIILGHSKDYRFVVVCGGGGVARKYIHGLRGIKKSKYFQEMIGIATTRMNARFMTYLFGEEANEGIPHDMKHVESLLDKNKVVFCGALRYASNETSDSTAAKLANFFDSPFINITDVSGLYEKDPKQHKDAKLITLISWKEFDKITSKISYKPGQHFILDQNASKIIKDNRIKTYIIGKNMKNLDNLLNKKRFLGTIIEG